MTMQHEEEEEQQQQQPLKKLVLPLGYKFRPSDQELLFHFLKNKLKDPISFQPAAPIYDIRLYDHPPNIILDQFGVLGHNNTPECYVFTMRHRKFLSGDRANRILKDNVGYWRASYSKRGDQFHERMRRCGGLVGERMNLVYYDMTTNTSEQQAAEKQKGMKKGTKTDWLMNEYKIKPAAGTDDDGAEEDLVLCKIYLNNRQKNKSISNHHHQQYNMQQEQPYLQQQQQQFMQQQEQQFEQPYLHELQQQFEQQQEQPYLQQQQQQFMQQQEQQFEQPYLQQQQEQFMQQQQQHEQPSEQPYLQQQQEQYMQQQHEQYVQQEEQPYLQQQQEQYMQQQQEQYVQEEQLYLMRQQQPAAAVDDRAASKTGTTNSIDTAEIDAHTFWDELMSQAPEPQQQTGMGMISIDDYAY